MNWLLPMVVFLPMIGAGVSYLVGRKSKPARNAFVCALTAFEFILAALALATAASGQVLTFDWAYFAGFGLHFKLDGFRALYVAIAAFMWMMTGLFSPQYFAHYHNRNRYYFFTLMTLGATAGVFLSDDLYTTFIFFEVMSFTSYTWVAHEENPGAMKAAETYLAIAVVGGMVTLMGLFMTHHLIGSLSFEALLHAGEHMAPSQLYLPGILVMFGFAAKAGAFPVHIWLPKAHPVAPAPASALLSGVLTKAGIFGVLVTSCNLFLHNADWGNGVLIIGLITMFLGALLALFSIDLKRTLACSSMSQIGFIAVGIGMMGLLGEENALAARGVVLHMVNHSLIKLCLFMVAGVVYMNLHQLDLNAIRGFGRKKPFLHFCYLMGALGIGGIPLWNGYVSKTLLHEGIVEFAHHLAAHGHAAGWVTAVEWLFLFSGGLTLAYMTKLYISIFVEKHPTRQAEFDTKKNYISPLSRVALGLSAIVLPVLGMTPGLTMDRLADGASGFLAAHLPAHAVHYFSFVNLKGAIISIAIGAVVYLLVIRLWLRGKDGSYLNRWPQKLDLEDLLYRPLLTKVLPGVVGWVMALFGENRILTPVCKGVLAFSGAAARGICALPDTVVALLRGTVFKPAKEPDPDPVHHSLSYRLGVWMDRCFPRGKGREPRTETYVRARQTLRRTTMGITGNLSFALLMCCLGICLLLLYLVFVYG